MREAFLSSTTLLGGGAAFILMGFIFSYLPSIFKRQLAERKSHAERLRHDGHQISADRLNDETKKIVIRIPQFGVGMIVFGAILMAVGVYL